MLLVSCSVAYILLINTEFVFKKGAILINVIW